MNNLLRMRYGRSGNRLERILVAAPILKSVSSPRWFRLLVVLVWIVVPLLVSRHTNIQLALPKTVIDISRLAAPPPLEREMPVPRKPVQIPPVERHNKIRAKSEESQVQVLPNRSDKPALPQPHDVKPPAITRPSVVPAPVISEYQPRITRERRQSGAETTAPSPMLIRRENPASETSSERTVISRTREATGFDEPSGKEGVALLRRSPAAAVSSPGSSVIQQPATRGSRNSGSPEASGESSTRTTAARERRQTSGTEEVGSTSRPGVVRGISLMSLEICASPQAEEDAIKAVLNIVGSRQECADEKGEFNFKGTKRISSFNLIIIPAKGRKPTNRCEELENAYRCLKIR